MSRKKSGKSGEEFRTALLLEHKVRMGESDVVHNVLHEDHLYGVISEYVRRAWLATVANNVRQVLPPCRSRLHQLLSKSAGHCCSPC